MATVPAPLTAEELRTDREQPGLVLAATVLTALLAVPLALLAVRDPKLALFGFAALIVLIVAALRVEFALLLLVATVPLEAAFELSDNEQLSISKLAGAICFASFVLFALATQRRLILDRSHAIVACILALAMISTLAAREISIALSTTVRYASFVALYIVVSQFVGDHRLQRRLVWTLSVASTIAGALTLHNLLTEKTTQASLFYANPNDTAFVLATTLPLTAWLLRERWLHRIPALLMIAIMSASIVLSFSRGALVGLAAGALFQALTERRHIIPLALAAVFAIVATVAFVKANPSQVQLGFEHKQRIAEYNVDSRLQAWRAALELTESHPLVGIGPGNFREYYFEATGNPPGTQNLLVVHNAYLDVATELGVLAAILFAAYVALMIGRATVAKRESRGPPGFAVAVRSALIVAAVSSLFLSEQYYAPLWLLGGLATALFHERRQAPVPAPAPAAARPELVPAGR